ncbi:hypothetical protein [Breoghania sp.]|uniref:hypothetical protein n=1 Tax=Breoghania sp. TaxID=2065378 RepID=UPI002AA8516F|nr:hypothetical protein [Breoghania sp.]
MARPMPKQAKLTRLRLPPDAENILSNAHLTAISNPIKPQYGRDFSSHPAADGQNHAQTGRQKNAKGDAENRIAF